MVDMDRRRFLETAAVAGAGWFLGSACRNEDPRDEWLKLSPAERIDRLELTHHPNFKNFDPTQELVQATAQYYCQRIQCRVPTTQLVQSVAFVDGNRIAAEVEKDNGRPLDEASRRFAIESVLETAPKYSNQLFLNRQNIQRESQVIRQQPALMQALGKRNVEVAFTKSVLFHAYAHANQSKESLQITPVNINAGDPGRPTTVTNIHGFEFRGTSAEGKPKFINGASEAMTDYVAAYATEGAGIYISTEKYTNGVRLVELINRRLGLTPQQFIEYYTGRRTTKDLWRAWGSIKNPQMPDETAAMLAMLVIALRVTNPGTFTQPQAEIRIRQYLGF